MYTTTPGYDSEMLVCFGRNLKHYRAMRNISLRKLAEETGISHSYLHRLEVSTEYCAGITLRKICTIANALDVPADSLLFDPKKRDRKSIVRQASKRLEDLLKDAERMASVIEEHI